MTARLAAAALVLGAFMSNCGGSESPSLSPRARVELEATVAAAKAAAAAHDADGARRELASIRARVEALERAGKISHAQAQAIHDSAIRVEQLLDTVTTTTTTLPPVLSTPGDDNDNGGPGKANDKGKGHGKK